MRQSRDDNYLEIAKIISNRATCFRRKVGCVLVDKRGHILSTGYNGRAVGLIHCNETNKCVGADSPSGENLDACEAIHAEQNALLQCPDVYKIYACYVTVSPCITCAKLLMNTSCIRIVFKEEYPHSLLAKTLWCNSSTGIDRTWVMAK